MDSKIYNHFALAKDLAKLLETQFKIGNLRFGLDAVLGIVPGAGDFVSFLLSLYIVWIGIGLKLPADKVALMLGNIIYDFFLGLVPVLGDLLDITFKANTKNLEIIEQFAPGKIYEGRYQPA